MDKEKMVKKHCVKCGKDRWHNPTVKDGKRTGERCTGCGLKVVK